MKNYTITVNGNVYDVTVEEKGAGVAPVAPVIKLFYKDDNSYYDDRVVWYVVPTLLILNTIYYIAY